MEQVTNKKRKAEMPLGEAWYSEDTPKCQSLYLSVIDEFKDSPSFDDTQRITRISDIAFTRFIKETKVDIEAIADENIKRVVLGFCSKAAEYMSFYHSFSIAIAEETNTGNKTCKNKI